MMKSNILLTISSIDILVLLFPVHKKMDMLSLQIRFFGTLLTKLVNKNRNDWDEHLSTILFSYQIAYKVGTDHTPFSASVWVTTIATYIISITI